MQSKKIFFALLTVAAFASSAFAASTGEGFFGTGAAPELETNPEPIAYPAPTPQREIVPEPIAPVRDTYAQPQEQYQPPVQPPMPEYENTGATTNIEDVRINSRRSTINNLFPKGAKLENQADNANKVIKSYGFDSGKTEVLLDKHKSASRAAGNREKSDRYMQIFNEFPMDYYAAYKAAKANYDMGRNSTAKNWVDKALSVNGGYVPAIILNRQINGALDRNSD